MYWLLLLLVLGTIASVAFVKNEREQKNKKIEEVFSGRDSLTATDFYERFFQDQGVPEEIVAGIRKVLEEQLEADLSRLVASDDFSKNIGFFFEYDSMADVEIVCALEEEFSIKIKDEEAQSAHTIQDIVNLVWRNVQQYA